MRTWRFGGRKQHRYRLQPLNGFSLSSTCQRKMIFWEHFICIFFTTEYWDIFVRTMYIIVGYTYQCFLTPCNFLLKASHPELFCSWDGASYCFVTTVEHCLYGKGYSIIKFHLQWNFSKPASTGTKNYGRFRGVAGFMRLPLQRNVQQELKKSAYIQEGLVLWGSGLEKFHCISNPY
jgi:hypothetical protein